MLTVKLKASVIFIRFVCYSSAEARSESMYADKRENERRLGDAKETVTSQRMELNKMAAMLESASERCATFQKLVESQNAASANKWVEGCVTFMIIFRFTDMHYQLFCFLFFHFSSFVLTLFFHFVSSPEGSDASDEAKIQLENAKREQENTLATLAATREKLSESEGTTSRYIRFSIYTHIILQTI